MTGFLLETRDDAIVTLTMNRPEERNALTEEHPLCTPRWMLSDLTLARTRVCENERAIGGRADMNWPQCSAGVTEARIARRPD